MKIIFLDFDGVLNSTASFIANKKAREAGLIDVFANPCKSAVALVDRLILSDPAIRVVISSTWRNQPDVRGDDWLGNLRGILVQDFGMSEDAAAMVICKTPNGFNRPRGHEIKWWLEGERTAEGHKATDGQEITHYVILDDNSDMTQEQKDGHFVQTDGHRGFDWYDLGKARKILGVPEDGYRILF